SDGLMSNVWKAMVALELEDQLKIKAMGLVLGRKDDTIVSAIYIKRSASLC
ncbi:hypothetical protein FRX31_012637, partial [Thalictrum thalictroides]